MSFYKNLKVMIDDNHEPSSWFSCGQVDEIRADTHFVIATAMVNTGFMCGGDGRVHGEWAWFNDVVDMIDYITNLVIPMNLCELEDQDPMLVITGDGDENIFDLPFSGKHDAIKEELRRLWKELRELKESGATFAQVEAALAESDKRSNDIYGELVFGFTCFNNRRTACEELLSRMLNPFDANRACLIVVMNRGFSEKGDTEFIQRVFAEYD